MQSYGHVALVLSHRYEGTSLLGLCMFASASPSWSLKTAWTTTYMHRSYFVCSVRVLHSRIFANILASMHIINNADVGMYALLGAAGFLGGLMRMSAAQVMMMHICACISLLVLLCAQVASSVSHPGNDAHLHVYSFSPFVVFPGHIICVTSTYSFGV